MWYTRGVTQNRFSSPKHYKHYETYKGCQIKLLFVTPNILNIMNTMALTRAVRQNCFSLPLNMMNIMNIMKIYFELMVIHLTKLNLLNCTRKQTKPLCQLKLIRTFIIQDCSLFLSWIITPLALRHKASCPSFPSFSKRKRRVRGLIVVCNKDKKLSLNMSNKC